jgi:hypothetical protein
VGSSVISGMQFRRTGAQADYNSVNVASLQDAEELLGKL